MTSRYAKSMMVVRHKWNESTSSTSSRRSIGGSSSDRNSGNSSIKSNSATAMSDKIATYDYPSYYLLPLNYGEPQWECFIIGGIGSALRLSRSQKRPSRLSPLTKHRCPTSRPYFRCRSSTKSPHPMARGSRKVGARVQG